jgi:hypothetical protein
MKRNAGNGKQCLNAKQKDWKPRQPTARGSILRDYADRNSCLIYGPEFQTMAPYRHNATSDVLDIPAVKDIVLLVHLTACGALNSDNLPIVIDTSCRSFFHKITRPPGLHTNGLGCIPGLP